MSSNDSSLRNAYAVAAGSVAAAAAASADAGIVYSGVQNISISQFTALQLNLDGDAYADLLLKNYVFPAGNYMGALVLFYPGKLVGVGLYASALSAGFSINASSVAGSFYGQMAYGKAAPNAQFNNASNKYIGLSFPSGALLKYGWVRVSVNQAAGSFIIHDWAYESSGEGIDAGAVPAPGALGLLALGPAGLGILRGRKRTA